MGRNLAMFSIILGALLLVAGIVLAATRTASRGRLSDLHATGPSRETDTLEPQGRGGSLSLKSDLPGLALMIAGAFLLLTGFL
jgi:hypothetical protein